MEKHDSNGLKSPNKGKRKTQTATSEKNEMAKAFLKSLPHMESHYCRSST